MSGSLIGARGSAGRGSVAGTVEPVTSLYELAGGEEALHGLEAAFYAKVPADPLLQPLFGEGQPNHVEHLTWFTAESFGGPDRFSRDLGFDHLIRVHRHLEITDEQRERFVALYMEALDESDLPDEEAFREAVRSHLEFGTRVAAQGPTTTAAGTSRYSTKKSIHTRM